MMKKVALVAAAAAMVLPLGLGVIAPATNTTTAFAATKKAAKKTTYALQSATKLKKAAYHVKAGRPALYSGAFAADRAKVTLSKKGTLKTGTTYYATKKIVVKAKATRTSKAKSVTYTYVKTGNAKVKGWVAAKHLTAGAAKKAAKRAVVQKSATKKVTTTATTEKIVKAAKAKGTTYNLVSAQTIKKSAYHFKAKAPAFYKGKFAADKAKVTLIKKGTLPVQKTFYATKKITIKRHKKTVKYLYVTNQKTKGFVLASKLTAGAFKAAD
ncbi:hypothetical protein H3M12_04540 [Levilactobacillus suantsaii]|uniref:Uncharacterized protein n=2 Tax=Levilactobacillus suantsaii TaxID=2292255 RepID=A0A4Q0VGS5_9LACO|nr:hypothetical protein H3M12_04540 [Levilactobacillus suantsaii]RXI78212.1 hypothetical protein DXH47_07735 [Levilactobacillus suantsaii]